MKLIVTGRLGLIGSNFILHICKKQPSWRIVNIDKKTYAGNPDNLAALGGNPRYRWLKSNITNRKKMSAALKVADAVVHFPAETHLDRSISDPEVFTRTNVLGTQVLLEADSASTPKSNSSVDKQCP